MNKCPNTEVFRKLASTFDRLEESAWFIQLMQDNYHSSNKFRWSLSAFLKSLKEVTQLLIMETQTEKQISGEITAKRKDLFNDPIIEYLNKQRDITVHKSMLMPNSSGSIGFTRGRGMKLGIGFPIDPLQDSVEAVKRYIAIVAKEEDFLGILYTEEDGSGEYTCVERHWYLSEFPDTEITALSITAWYKVAQVVVEVGNLLGAELVIPSLELKDPNKLNFEIYNPEWINDQLKFYKNSD